jgi:hypothetical protein
MSEFAVTVRRRSDVGFEASSAPVSPAMSSVPFRQPQGPAMQSSGRLPDGPAMSSTNGPAMSSTNGT